MSVTLDQLNKSEQKFIKKYEKLLNVKREKNSNNDNKNDSNIHQNKKMKYKNNENSILPKNKKIKYKNNEESFVPHKKIKKNKNDEESFVPQNKIKKYKNDEDKDEESENNQSLSLHKNENKFNKKYNEHNNNNKENKKIYKRQNSFDCNFSDNNDKNDFSMSSKFERSGTLLEDIPVKILNVGTKNMNDKHLFCLVRWEQKSKDLKILDSIIDINKIKRECPKLLIDFYESKIIFNHYLDD
jgi:hypothetical protein